MKIKIKFDGKFKYLFNDSLKVSWLLNVIESVLNINWLIIIWSIINDINIIIIVTSKIKIVSVFEYLNISFEAILVM